MRRRLLLGFALAALAANAFAAIPRFKTAAQPALALVQPANGATLRGGEFATIAWRAVRPVDGEEWEAFVSLDGGRYYSARLTPHLDIERRSFTFIVPNVASDDVRILIRTGDERDETIVEFPQRFAIRATASTDPVQHTGTPEEPARPSDAVVANGKAGTQQTLTRALRDDERPLAVTAASAHVVITPRTTAIARIVEQRALLAIRIARTRDVLRLVHRLNV